MERARKQGKRIGRPPVTERDGFAERFTQVVERIGTGGLSRRQAARELHIGFATLKRLLDEDRTNGVVAKTRPMLLPSAGGRYTPETRLLT
jgi:DNA invertase Pin-like site-specific DNA recombinase